MTGEPEPNWPRRAVEALIDEWRGFFVVVAASTLHPVRFAREWADGERRVLNPLACALNAFGISFVWTWLCARMLGAQLPQLFKLDFSEPWFQLVTVMIFGSLYHFPLRWLGSRRRWRTTVGAQLYTAAGPWLLLHAVTTPWSLYVVKQGNAPWLALVTLPLMLPQLAYYVLPQVGAHRLAWWRALLAFVIFMFAMMTVMIVLSILIVGPWLRHHPDMLILPDMK